MFMFHECIGPREITRQIHVEEWHCDRCTNEDMTDTPSQMDNMFVQVCNKIVAAEQQRDQEDGQQTGWLVDKMQEEWFCCIQEVCKYIPKA
jgi:hypothetical protein